MLDNYRAALKKQRQENEYLRSYVLILHEAITNKGITIGAFTEYKKRKGQKAPTVDDLKNISDAEWHDVFKSLYWDRWKADEIKNQSVAIIS